MISVAVALDLHDAGLLVYSEDPLVRGNTRVGSMPPEPDVAFGLLDGQSRDTGDDLAGWGDRAVRIRVRGGEDPQDAHDRAAAVYKHYRNRADVTLAAGTPHEAYAMSTDADPPAGLGMDGKHRHEYVVVVRLHVLDA